jgi:hypothetical protein
VSNFEQWSASFAPRLTHYSVQFQEFSSDLRRRLLEDEQIRSDLEAKIITLETERTEWGRTSEVSLYNVLGR